MKILLSIGRLLPLLVFLSVVNFMFSSPLSAQSKEDVVYLKTGSIIRGTLLTDSSSQIVRILNHSGDVWVFSKSEVDSVRHEKAFDYKLMQFSKPGFEFGLQGELLMRSGVNAVGNAVIPGLNAQIAYRPNPFLAIGTEIGIEFYNWMEIPVSASIRLRTSDRIVSPVLFLRTGYTIPAEDRVSDWEYRYIPVGGLHYSFGVGFEKIISNKTSFLLTFAYHYQQLNYHLIPLQAWIVERDRTEAYSRLRISIGYVFK